MTAVAVLIYLVSVSINTAGAQEAQKLILIPTPKSVTVGTGTARLTVKSQIIVNSPILDPLACILSDEIGLATGVRLVTGPETKFGGIVLKLDSTLTGEAYRIKVDRDVATVSGGNYNAVAAGTATLLQGLTARNGYVDIPRMTIEDEPTFAYRGAMLDLGRKYHTPQGIEQVIELCRIYKIRYLQLHLSDDQLFMFASTRFPQLGKSNQEFARFEPGSKPHIAPYTLQELRGLEEFSRERGVFLVPEIDLPGHSGRMIANAQDIFGIPGNGSTVNIASPTTLEALTTLLNEVMDVFKSTPYVHLGADEVSLGGLEDTEEYKQAQATYGVKSVHDLYCKFVCDMHDVIAKHGKKTIVWEEAFNTEGPYPLPEDTLVMLWSLGRNPNDVTKAGYQVINAGWTPLYIVRNNKRSPEFLSKWFPQNFGGEGAADYTTLKDTTNLQGAQLCSWENSEGIEVQSLRERLAIVAEKLWNPTADAGFTEFGARFHHTDSVLEKLVNPITITAQATFAGDENTFITPLILKLSPVRHEHGAKLTLKYTLDNSLPNPEWKTYNAPLTITKTIHLRAGLFDERGNQHGYLVGAWYQSAIPVKPNLATNRPVSVGPGPDRTDEWASKVAVDGHSDDPNQHWASIDAAPQSLTVDLEKIQRINFINVITYWDNSRYYQLTAEASVDGKIWKKVMDLSENTKPATSAGYSARFAPVTARYVRINMLKNSANPYVHIVELVVDYIK